MIFLQPCRVITVTNDLCLLLSFQIPEFDYLYLDMNGIIHTCSHPNDDVCFRISEEMIFKNIFHYIEVLFNMIRPQKLFFMAIDGVAPRAKINQQRGRRFRAAKDVEVQEAKAKSKGILIPNEKRFDSNCITPGTLFMAKLGEQLKRFVEHKISDDDAWKKCKILFSGSEVFLQQCNIKETNIICLRFIKISLKYLLFNRI